MKCIFNDAKPCPTPEKMCPGCPTYERALDLAGDSELAAKYEADRRDGLAHLADGHREMQRQLSSGAVDWRG